SGVSTADSLALSSAGSISNQANAELNVAGNATFTAATDITLGDQADDKFMFGTLTFSGTAVTIAEDDATNLSGVSTADSLALSSAGSISDAAKASVSVTNMATFHADGEIWLADEADNVLEVGKLATFQSSGGKEIEVGVDNSVIRGTDSGAMVLLGQLTFVSDDSMQGRGSVTIREDHSMQVTGVNLAADLFLAADGSITQVEDGNALTADRIDLDVNGDGSQVGDALFEAADGDDIQLFGDVTANMVGEPIASFLAENKIAGAEFRAAGGGNLGDVYYRNVSAAALFPTLPDSITGTLRIQFTATDLVIDDDISVGDQLILEALGTLAGISDVDGIEIDAKDAVIVADGSIALADEGANALQIGVGAQDNAFFYSRSGQAITLGASDADATASGATVEFASLTFVSSDGATNRGDVVIHETDSTRLASRRFDVNGSPLVLTNQADSLVLISDGDLTDADADGSLAENILRASVDVANRSVMIAGGEIHLADQTQISVDGIELGVYSLGHSDGDLDNDGAMFVTLAGGNIRVGVSDATAADSGAKVLVDGLTFYAMDGLGNAYFQIDGETKLASRDFAGMTYDNLADDLVLRVDGSIISAGGEITTLLGDARFLADGDILLANSDPDAQLLVEGNAFFQTSGSATIGDGSDGVNFGTLTFDASGNANITESNAGNSWATPGDGMTIADTTFDGGSANYADSVVLVSDSFIHDASATTIEISKGATLTAVTVITLADQAGDTLTVKGDASFTSSGGQAIDIGVMPAAATATVRGTDNGAAVNLGAVHVHSVGGDVTVYEDSGMLLTGFNQAKTLVLAADQGDIRDRAATRIDIAVLAEFHAQSDIVLADEKSDELKVAGNALFTSGNSDFFVTPNAVREISVGAVDVDSAANPNAASRGVDSGALVTLGSVTFFGFADMDAGAHVTIREDASMQISHSARLQGMGGTEIENFAQTAMLIADNVADDATITDAQIDGAGGTSIETTDYAIFEADSQIILANEIDDMFNIEGNAYFASQFGDIDLGVVAKSVNALDRGADSGADVQLGTLTFLAKLGDVTIHEDSDTTLANGNALRDTGSAANSLLLQTAGSIDDAAGTSLVIAQLSASPLVGSADDQVDGLAILRAGGDVHWGDSLGDSIDMRRLLLDVGGDVSIIETSTSDGGLLVVDGSEAAGTLAIKTDGHLVQINDERTGASSDLIVADQALLVSGGAIVVTNADFQQATLQAHGTLLVTPGAALNATDAANGGLLGRRTTDPISSDLPDSNDDTFAPKGPSTTPETQTNMDGRYSVVVSDVNDLTFELVVDAFGSVAADPVTLAFPVVGGDDLAIADFTPALSAVGVAAGHLFVQTSGDLTFSENGGDPLDDVVVYGEVRMSGSATTNNAFTALAGGNLIIAGDSMLVMRSAADFYLANGANNTLTPYVGGGLADSIGSLGAVHSFATFVDVDTQVGFIEVGEFGPVYQRTPQDLDPDASTSQIAKAIGFGQFQINATIANLGDASTINVDGQPVYVEQNFRLLVDWGDGTQSVYLFQDPIDGAQTLQHTYSSGFAYNEQRATVTITAFNDPQINLYDNVVDETNFRDLNSVTDTFEVILPVGVQFAPESPPFELPSAPEVVPVAFLPETVLGSATVNSFSSDSSSLNQVQEVVVVIVNALDEEVGERVVLQGFSTIEEVKQYIQEGTQFLPGRYKVSILLAGQQEPDVYYFEKVVVDSQNGGGAYHAPDEVFVRDATGEATSEISAEQVWAAQYEQWFDADEAAVEDDAPFEREDLPVDFSALLLEDERAKSEAEDPGGRRRSMLPGGIGGALMMAAFALDPYADRQRQAALEDALKEDAKSASIAKSTRGRRRWRRRIR
ncbi:MAG: beta strand repeat-containing protein, partial [Blastopirellula sp. JB062]